MRVWDNFRTAFQLADRVEEVEARLKEVEFEWGEIEEKLLAREERLRKRLSRELKKELDTPVGSGPTDPTSRPQLVAPEGAQAAKRAIERQWRESRQEG